MDRREVSFALAYFAAAMTRARLAFTFAAAGGGGVRGGIWGLRIVVQGGVWVVWDAGKREAVESFQNDLHMQEHWWYTAPGC